MQYTLTQRAALPIRPPAFPTLPDLTLPSRQSEKIQTNEDDEHFISMLQSYRENGGLARGTEVVSMFQRLNGANLALLAGWILDRKVICFEWQSRMWLPLFQFKRLDMTPQEELDPLFEEFGCKYCPWQLANWFARPNAWLQEKTPADTFVIDLPATLNAARADRFFATV